MPHQSADIINLNVGGQRFSTSRQTLTWISDSFFTAMLGGLISTNRDEQGYIFIDRDPKLFSIILNYLRTKELDINGCDLHMLKHECEFYGVQPLIRRLQLCEDLEHSQCGDVLFNGYINPPHSTNTQISYESTQLLPAQPIVYQPALSQPTSSVRPGTALRLNNIMQQTLNRSASQIGDFRYEYPGAKDQGAEPHSKTGYTKLVKKLSQMFQQEAEETGKEKLLLTCATAAARHRIEAGYEVKEVCKYFDFVSVMTYDYHGSWEGKTGHNSPLYGMRNERKKFREWNINSSMNVWVELGCPKEKLNVGLSAYGRAFSLLREPGLTNNKSMRKKKTSIGLKAGAAEAGKYTREAGVLSYYEICELIQKNPSNRVLWHREMNVPYVSSEILWIGYDNIRSVKLKMQFLKEHGYGGIIIWSLDLDDKTGEFCNEGPFPLFNAAKNELLIIPEHLSNVNKKCLDDNSTLSLDQLFSQSITITGIHRNFVMDEINNRNNEYIKTELITKLLKHFLPEDKSSRLSSEMVKYFTELIFIFIHQALTRTIQQASTEGTIHVDIQHFEKILMQLLLDF
ncbi:unnamed protein product [Rotaria sp. Silwood1]|nr:unnamed protein product [Rotaria sp. Silwood1]